MIAALAASLLALTPAAAGLNPEPALEPGPDARSAPLDQVFPFWTDYQALEPDERDAFDLSYQIDAPLRGDGTAFRFWVETRDGGFDPLPASGPVTPPDSAAFEQGLRLFTDAPRGAVRVVMRLTLPGEPRDEYQREELEAALAQAHNAMRRAMGIRSLFMPRLDTVRFVFDGPAPDADFVADDGEIRPIMDVYETEILVTPGDREIRDAVAVRFGRPPLFAVLETRS
jgi:hypothetical protein